MCCSAVNERDTCTASLWCCFVVLLSDSLSACVGVTKREDEGGRGGGGGAVSRARFCHCCRGLLSVKVLLGVGLVLWSVCVVSMATWLSDGFSCSSVSDSLELSANMERKTSMGGLACK